MKVVRYEAANNPTDGASSAAATTPATRVTSRPTSPPPAPPEEAAAPTPKPGAVSGQTRNVTVPAEAQPANVTFRRDEQGKVYYVLTDAESGKEIREVPPAEIRKVGQGIADYLKQEAAKGTSRVKIKA